MSSKATNGFNHKMFGCVKDPEGLCQADLSILFNAEQSINHFDASQLSARGRVYDASTDGCEMMNTMHGVVSDIFVMDKADLIVSIRRTTGNFFF